MSSRTWIAVVVAVACATVVLWRTDLFALPPPPEGLRGTEGPRAVEAPEDTPTTRATLPTAAAESSPDRTDPATGTPPHKPPNRPTISGRVVDRHGTPMANVPIGHEPWIDGTLATVRSDDDGRFVLPAPRVDPPPVRLVVSMPGEFLTDGDTGLVPWHTEDWVVVVRRGGSCEVEALDAATGRPIPRYDVFVASSHAAVQDRAITDSHRIESNDGVGTIDGLVDGPCFVWVLPVGNGYRLTEARRVEITPDHPTRVTMRVEPTVPVTVTVIGPGGDPLHGARVSLHDPGTDPTVAAYPARQPLSWQLDGRTAPFSVPQEATLDLDWGATNAEGTVTLGGFSRRGRIDVRVEANGHPAVTRRGVPLGSTPIELVVEVTAGARLTGTIDPSQARIHGLEVVVRPPGQHGQPTTIRDDGVFSIAGLTEGRHEVLVGYRAGRQLRLVPIVLAEVELAAGDTRHVDLDASPCLPASLVGTALVNGKPWNAGPVRLHPLHDGRPGAGYLERVGPDRHGAFRFDRIPPGNYRLVGFLEESGESFEFPEPIQLTANQLTRMTFRASR